MKLFKNLMIVLSASLLLWGCSDDDESINSGNSTISLSTNNSKWIKMEGMLQ